MTTYGSRRNTGRKQYIYRLKPADPEMLTRNPSPEEAEAVHFHYEYLKQLAVIDRLILMGRTTTQDESTFGVVIFEADSDEDALRIMNNDPAVQGGVMQAELFPFKVMVQRKPGFGQGS
jgi:uncharacterized protein YciI